LLKRIAEYGFVENQYFASFSEIYEKPQGGRPSVEYFIPCAINATQPTAIAIIRYRFLSPASQRYARLT